MRDQRWSRRARVTGGPQKPLKPFFGFLRRSCASTSPLFGVGLDRGGCPGVTPILGKIMITVEQASECTTDPPIDRVRRRGWWRLPVLAVAGCLAVFELRGHAAAAAAAVLIYRLLSCWILLPVGAACWSLLRTPGR